ncbi:hypothetical protein F511_15932 [Dorcoceras hygrometricum]|uniref:Uncharacterized protein n=1 Tax=Dorcoceras hygrometricum TaxID=472368 RepID=A0A2Z7C3A3_9LAMI|nr:hypothetical protein F511_15932 [Dorcoceras hygrometricum]
MHYFDCDRPGCFAADYSKPKKDDKKNSDRRRHRSDKKLYIKRRDHKVLVGEEIKIKWADSDSKESTSSISSSDSEQEEIQSLMEDDNSDEVFDF